MAKLTGRAGDDRLLGWIRDRVRGRTVAAIAAENDVCPQAVAQATNLVRAADLAFCADCPADGDDAHVAKAYW